jgi:hypothetical protein
MSAMLGSSRRASHTRGRGHAGEAEPIERSPGPIRLWILRPLARLLMLFGPPQPRT